MKLEVTCNGHRSIWWEQNDNLAVRKGFDSFGGLPSLGLSNMKQGAKLGIRLIMISVTIIYLQEF